MTNDNPAGQSSEQRTAAVARPLRILAVILIAGLLTGILDLVYAMTFHGLSGVPPVRILQAIASGLLGRDAYTTGSSTAVMGAALHFGMTTIMSAAYVLASLKFPRLRRQPLTAGIVYGLLLYVVMTFVVVPLSAALPRSAPLVEMFFDVLAHVCLVGLPIAFIARHLISPVDAVYPPGGNKPV